MIILPPGHVYPIEGCSPVLVLPTKAKYQWNYTEKHLPIVPVSHFCIELKLAWKL